MNDEVREIYRKLSGVAALAAAQRTTLGKIKGEADTEFIKRIVAQYLWCAVQLGVEKI